MKLSDIDTVAKTKFSKTEVVRALMGIPQPSFTCYCSKGCAVITHHFKIQMPSSDGAGIDAI